MTPETLARVCVALYGDQWQAPLARALGVADRTVRRWVSGASPVPSGLASDLLAVARERGEEVSAAIKILEGDMLKAKVVWPLPHKEGSVDISGMNNLDLWATLDAIDASEMRVAFFDDDGKKLEHVHIEVNDQLDGKNTFFSGRLDKLLLDGLGSHMIDEPRAALGAIEPAEHPLSETRHARLLVRLLRAHQEWEETDAKMTLDELRANPLPALKGD